MYAFQYQRAKTIADAASSLAKSGGKALAGGQSLVGAMKLRLANPGALVDLSGIAELKGIKKEGDAVVIGALTTHAEVASSTLVKQAIPALAALAESIGDRQVRNRGTIGGSIAHNDPAADYPAAVLGLRRDHHRGELPRTQEGRVREVSAACVALCVGGRARRANRGRSPRRGDRRGFARAPREGAGGRAGEELHCGGREGGEDSSR
jgi:hypothetical protein